MPGPPDLGPRSLHAPARKEAETGRKGRTRLRKLRVELAKAYPALTDAEDLIRGGSVIVDGVVISNPDSLVREGAAISIRADTQLRGQAKLHAALDRFGLDVRDRVALDVGAAAGGFTLTLLEAGARKVYAVDAGHGQLLGSLRQDPRVVNLEGVNLGDLDRELVPETIEVFTLDLSYLALRDAAPQLENVTIARAADAVALVKPQFELGLSQPPTDEELLATALERARQGFATQGWIVAEAMRSPVQGRRGSTEFLLHAVRNPV